MTPDPKCLEIARGIWKAWSDDTDDAGLIVAIAAAIQTAVEEKDAEWRKQTEEQLNAGRALMDGIRALYPSYIGQGQTTEIAWINQQTLGELQARSVAYEEYRVRAENAEAELARLTAENAELKAGLDQAIESLHVSMSAIGSAECEIRCLTASRDALADRIKERLCAEVTPIPDLPEAGIVPDANKAILFYFEAACRPEELKRLLRALVDQAKEG